MADPVTKSVIVKTPVAQAYQIWSNFETFPRFMKNIKSVSKTGAGISHWVMEGPAGRDIQWDATTTLMEENNRIAWNSTGGDIETSGQVSFHPLSDDSTQVTVIMKYVAPMEALAQLFTNPEGRLEEDLNNFKRYAEGSSQTAETRTP